MALIYSTNNLYICLVKQVISENFIYNQIAGLKKIDDFSKESLYIVAKKIIIPPNVICYKDLTTGKIYFDFNTKGLSQNNCTVLEAEKIKSHSLFIRASEIEEKLNLLNKNENKRLKFMN